MNLKKGSTRDNLLLHGTSLPEKLLDDIKQCVNFHECITLAFITLFQPFSNEILIKWVIKMQVKIVFVPCRTFLHIKVFFLLKSRRPTRDPFGIFSLHIERDILTCSSYISCEWKQCLSQDFETGCLKLAVVKFWGVQIFKGDHNILIFQPQTCIHSSKLGMISLNNVMGVIRRWKHSIISLRFRFFLIPLKEIWVSWRVLFKGLGVQKGTQTPCWLRPWMEVFKIWTLKKVLHRRIWFYTGHLWHPCRTVPCRTHLLH